MSDLIASLLSARVPSRSNAISVIMLTEIGGDNYETDDMNDRRVL